MGVVAAAAAARQALATQHNLRASWSVARQPLRPVTSLTTAFHRLSEKYELTF
jgi:hypothetical protein